MLWFRRVVAFAVGMAVVAGAAAARAQAVAAPDASVEAAIESLASRAALVFVGQVVAIERHAGVVEIVFRVDRPVVGQVGTRYTLREWAGLWPPGQWRYRVGERAMVFLHAASTAGFSSAVDGGEGVVPVVGAPDGTPLVDVRRLATRVQRKVGDPLPGAAEGAMALEDVLPLVMGSADEVRRRPVRRPLPPAMVQGGGPAGTVEVQLQPEAADASGQPGGRVLQRRTDAAQ